MRQHKSNLFSIFLLSILDAIFTYIWLQNGIAEEANPILEICLEAGDFWFFAAKISLTGLGCAVLWNTRDSHWSQKAGLSLLIMYTLLNLYHIFGAAITIFN